MFNVKITICADAFHVTPLPVQTQGSAVLVLFTMLHHAVAEHVLREIGASEEMKELMEFAMRATTALQVKVRPQATALALRAGTARQGQLRLKARAPAKSAASPLGERRL